MNPLDQITITGLRAKAHHGVFDEERRNGQLFIVDVTVSLDFSKAAASDDLGLTIHYGELAEEVIAAVESDPVDLIETVAERVACPPRSATGHCDAAQAGSPDRGCVR